MPATATFTEPKTWAFQEGVESAELNVIRDILRSMGPHLIGRKTSDQSVTSSTVLVDCTGLDLTVAANEIWQIEYRLRMVAGISGAGGYKLAWTFPASAELEMQGVSLNSAAAVRLDYAYGTTSIAQGLSMDVAVPSASVNSLFYHGFYVGAGTAGTVKLQFAQYNSNATSTTIKAHSTCWAVQLA
jgi:hypothetical protein